MTILAGRHIGMLAGRFGMRMIFLQVLFSLHVMGRRSTASGFELRRDRMFS